jgi:hypothetical protein
MQGGHCPVTNMANQNGAWHCCWRCSRGDLGLLAGRYLYVETSGYLASTIEKIGKRGGVLLPESFLGRYSR